MIMPYINIVSGINIASNYLNQSNSGFKCVSSVYTGLSPFKNHSCVRQSRIIK